MNLKNLAKKGGIESIVGVIILVALVIVLIIAFVIPMVQDASEAGTSTRSDSSQVFSYADKLMSEGWSEAGIAQGD